MSVRSQLLIKAIAGLSMWRAGCRCSSVSCRLLGLLVHLLWRTRCPTCYGELLPMRASGTTWFDAWQWYAWVRSSLLLCRKQKDVVLVRTLCPHPRHDYSGPWNPCRGRHRPGTGHHCILIADAEHGECRPLSTRRISLKTSAQRATKRYGCLMAG